MRTFVGIFVFLLVGHPAWGGTFSSSAKGTSSVNSLKLGAGARAMGMGEAYSAMADEASAVYWNPAAMTRIQSRSITVMHALLMDSSFMDFGAYVHNQPKFGAWGLGFQYYLAGSITETDAAGTERGTFNPHDYAISLGYARRLDEEVFPSLLRGFALGYMTKFVRSTIIETSETAALDLGLLSPAYLDGRLRLAATAVNLGGKVQFEGGGSEPLPVAYRLGSSYRFSPAWAASLDLGFPRDNDPFVAAGTEYWLTVQDDWRLAGRMGFNSRTIGDIDGFTGVSFGLGFLYRGLALDYALLPMGGVGQAHRISLSRAF